MRHWMGGGLNNPPPTKNPERMTMSKRKLSFWTKVKRFFMRFNMCECNEPKYEVIAGILTCTFCGKPTKWKK